MLNDQSISSPHNEPQRSHGIVQKQPPEVFCKKGVLKSFTRNFTGKHLCWCLFLITLLVFRPATLLKRHRSSHQRFTGKHLRKSRFLLKLQAFTPSTFSKRDSDKVLFCEYCEIFKNTVKKQLRTTASENTPTLMLSYEIFKIFKNTYFEEHQRQAASIYFNSKYYSVAEFGIDETSTDCILFKQMQLYNLYVR